MIAVAGGKGGCGKTTTTLGLARAAARAGDRALAVDADAGMPDLHRVAGVDREPTLGDGPPGAVAQPHPDCPAAAVLPAPRDRLARSSVLARCRGTRPTVLVDAPAGAGPDAAAPLRAADATVLVTTLEPACLRDAARTAAMSRALDTPVVGAVVSRAGRAPDGVGALLETGVLGCVPYADDGVSKSQASGALDAIYREVNGRRR